MSGVHRQRAMDPEEPLFVIEEGQINLNYRLGLLAVTVAEEEQSLQVILVAKFNGKNLVAVPSTAWHKKQSSAFCLLDLLQSLLPSKYVQ